MFQSLSEPRQPRTPFGQLLESELKAIRDPAKHTHTKQNISLDNNWALGLSQGLEVQTLIQ